MNRFDQLEKRLLRLLKVSCVSQTLESVPVLIQVQSVHPRLSKLHIAKRLEAIKSGEGIDWSTAEALAFGTLMQDGYHVRICGQDSGRVSYFVGPHACTNYSAQGTFSQRHAVLTDQQTEAACIPLNSLKSAGRLDVAASPLSEFAVMGFEMGMSWSSPKLLNLWEAQFGVSQNDFGLIILLS